ncbi:MAG: hypothetical protein WC277_10600 [Bacilli bacterium]|jgi:hypothetical protein
MNPDALWQAIADATLAAVDQHKYAWSLMWTRLPKAAYAPMERGEHLLTLLRSELEGEMFRAGGPQDINVFYPVNRPPSRQYTARPGPRPPALTIQEWRAIGEELERCLSCSGALVNLISGNVRAKTMDQAIKYQDTLLRAKMALEPHAQKHVGFWSVLYPGDSLRQRERGT